MLPYLQANPANLAPTGTTNIKPMVSPQLRAFRFSQNRKIFPRIHFIALPLIRVRSGTYSMPVRDGALQALLSHSDPRIGAAVAARYTDMCPQENRFAIP